MDAQCHLEEVMRNHNAALGVVRTSELRLEVEQVLGAMAITVDSHEG